MDLCQSNDSLWKLEKPFSFERKVMTVVLRADPPGFALCSADSAARFTARLSGFCDRKLQQVGQKKDRSHVKVKKWWKIKKGADSDKAVPHWFEYILIVLLMQHDSWFCKKNQNKCSLKTEPYLQRLSADFSMQFIKHKDHLGKRSTKTGSGSGISVDCQLSDELFMIIARNTRFRNIRWCENLYVFTYEL